MRTCTQHFGFLVGAMLLVLLAAAPAQAQPWTRMPTPNPSTTRNQLRGISSTGPADGWAVGHYDATGTGNLLNLVLHYDGTAWQPVASPRPAATSTLADLYDVVALSPTNAWAVGHYAAAGIGSRAQMLQWNGTAWQAAGPAQPAQSALWALDALGGSELWAVGIYVNPAQPSILEQGYVLHYDGQQWSQQPTPVVGTFRNRLNAVDALTSADVWAVGTWGNTYGDFRPLLLHYDGTAWSSTPPPASLQGVLAEMLEVAAVAPNDVWALGNRTAGGNIVLHYNGTAWSEVPNSGSVGGALAVVGPNDIYAVGPNVSHWDGTAWTVVDPLAQAQYPALISSTLLPTGEIWAAGVASDASLPFATLVYRSNTTAPLVRISGPAGPVAAGSAVPLTATPSRPGSYQFRWSPATGLSNPNIATPVATPPTTTTYTVTMTETSTGAVAQATALLRVTTATASAKATPLLELAAWPSPFEGQLTCRIGATRPAPATLVLTDALGREVLRQPAALHAGENVLTLRPPQRTSGVYLLTLQTAEQQARLRLVRE